MFTVYVLTASLLFSQSQAKLNSDRSAQRHKKPKDNKPKVDFYFCF